MAAIYSGIYLKLKSAQTPWEDKIKLARFAWISSQCLLPNKEQVLLDWCTHALTGWYKKKVDFPQNVLDGLWCYLDDLLHSRKLHSFLKQGKSISLRLNMAQLLLDRLQDHGHSEAVCSVGLSTLLSVCQGILSAPELSSIFTTKYELMVSLMSRLISLASHQLQQLSGSLKSDHESDMEALQSQPAWDADKEFDIGHQSNLQADSKSNSKFTENLASDKLFEVLLLALTCYSLVQRQQPNPNRVFTLVTDQLFQPMIFLRHWLSPAALSSPTPPPVSQQMCRDIRTKIDTILQLALFAPERMSLYQEELTKADSGKRVSGTAKRSLKPTSVLLSKLTVQSFCEPSLYYAVKSNIVPVLFKLFLESYGTAKGERNEEQGMLCFFFLVSLSNTLNLGLESHLSKNTDLQMCPSPQSAPCRPESWSLALLAVESLLNSALFGDIYNVAADRIRHGEVQLRFYRSLAEMLLKQAQPSIPAWYRCLKALLSLNHLILEPDLEQLLSLAWVNMDCTNSRVLQAKQVAVCSILQTYTKLRQMPKLFSDLLSVITKTALDQPRPPLLSGEVFSTLRTCLLDTPSSQTIEICLLVLQSIKKYTPQKQTITDDINVQDEVAFNADSSLKIMSLSQILHSVLFNLKTLDNGSPLPLVRQSQKLMETMHEVIKELQQHLAKVDTKTKPSVQKPPKKVKKGQKVVDSETNSQINQNTLEATLLLRYTLVEVDTLFSIHCSKYTSLEPAHQVTSENEDQITSASPVIECIQNLLSGEIFPQSVVIASGPFSSLLLRHLLLQQMKKILSMPSMLSEPSSTGVLNQAAHFIASEIEKCLNVDQMWIGHMYAVNGSSYLVAYWYLVTSNLPLILPYLDDEDVRSIATVLIGSQLTRPTQDKDTLHNCLTVPLISSQLLKSHIFPELPSLFSATVQFLLQSVLKVLRTAPQNLDIFQNTSRIQKEMVVERILASLTIDNECVELSSTQKTDILNMLQIMKVLNPDGMSSEDLTDCFLLLIFLLTSTTCQTKDVDHTDDPSCLLLKGLIQILISLLEGTNFPSVLKFIHGGTLLQAVVSSVLRHSLISTENPDWLDLVKEMQAFISCLVQLIITRSSSIRLNLNQFASFLCSKETKDKLTDRASVSTLTAHVLLASLSTFSCTLTSNLGKSRSLDELLTQILMQTTATLRLAVKSILKPQAILNVSSIFSEAFVLEVVTVMLKCELSLYSMEENKQTCSISHMPLYQGCSLQVLKEINSAPRPREFLVSSLHFLSTFYSAVKMMAEKQENDKESKDLDDLFMTILQSLQRLLTAHWLSSTDLHDLEPTLQKLLCHLVDKCSSERFNQMLLMIKEGLDTVKLRGGNYREVLSTVILVKLLFCCPLPEACFNALWFIAPQIISTMMFLIKSSSQDVSLNLPFTIPVMATVTALLRQGEGVIANPHHVTMVLGALQWVPLDHLAPDVYEATFTAIHETLFAIIKCHPQVMLKAAPSFLNVFYRLVASIMQEGKQRKDADADSGISLRCSMLVERMCSHIAATSEDFTTLSAFIVAQYVTELQKVTLRPDVKMHLTEGIYMILDLCLEQDIKFLMAGLHTGVREVFNELYSSYTHYHKTQRQGEEKYTV
ncbi:unhealthy ribosome biogenesis protein 2 homolog [Periophthalmus magnuspinnatus]|uniref:unhealthy ribosome biogenesis protein 2 homolog n=1 Tax=Periophthalmus magnuspinnatus TaxID=409849 RepID=UPI00145AAA09|nr:unhealthy ribosome biogenesis protein 2 homolog [Periophthalmus magnuspinnatus]